MTYNMSSTEPYQKTIMNDYHVSSSTLYNSISSQNNSILNNTVCNRPGHPEDNFPSWSLPSIFSHQTSTSKSIGLRNFTKEQLQPYLEPILERLIHLDAEELLGLERVQTGGAILKDG